MKSPKPPRQHPERPIIEMLLSEYENGTWKGASLEWLEDKERNAVEVVATKGHGETVALEHTLIEKFVGEKDDNQSLMCAFARIDKNPDLVLPQRDLEVVIEVGALQKGYDWNAIGEELLVWLKANHEAAPYGNSKHIARLGGKSKKEPLSLTISLHCRKTPGIEGSCLLLRDSVPQTLDKVIEKALKNKIPKLLRTEADKHILLLERDQVSNGSGKIDLELQKQLPCLSSKLQLPPESSGPFENLEIWHANTSLRDSYQWVYFNQYRSGRILEALTFHKGILQQRNPHLR